MLSVFWNWFSITGFMNITGQKSHPYAHPQPQTMMHGHDSSLLKLQMMITHLWPKEWMFLRLIMQLKEWVDQMNQWNWWTMVGNFLYILKIKLTVTFYYTKPKIDWYSYESYSSQNTKLFEKCDLLQRTSKHDWIEEDIQEESKPQSVTKVERIKRWRNGQLMPTDSYILTINSQNIPSEIKIGFLIRKTKVYIPNLKRCSNCPKYGHSSSFLLTKGPSKYKVK